MEENELKQEKNKNYQVTARVTPEKKELFDGWLEKKEMNSTAAVNLAIDLLMNQDTDADKECDFSKEKKRVGGLCESINNIFDEVEKLANQTLQQQYLNNEDYNGALTKQVEELHIQLSNTENEKEAYLSQIKDLKDNVESLAKENKIKDSDLDSKAKLIDSFKLNAEQFDTLKKENAELKGLNKQLASEHDDQIRLQTEFKNTQKDLEEQKKLHKEDAEIIKKLEKQVATLTKELEIENVKNADKQAIIEELKAKKKPENNENGENIENIENIDKIGILSKVKHGKK